MPEEMAFRNWLYGNMKSVAESFGFSEYDGPILETLDLYAAKSGEEFVKKQAFTLLDKSGKTLALRPEMTPTLARIVSQKAGSLVFPIKWFNFGPRFRYETPQKGRGREFFQWDIDILGSDNLQADAEVIAIAAIMYQRLGLSPSLVKIKINERQYLTGKLLGIGIDQIKIIDIFKIIDRKSKVSNDDFNEMLSQAGLESDQIAQLELILFNKEGWRESGWLRGIMEAVKIMGVGEYIEFDPTIVRGLDYYTKTVFEGWDVRCEFRSIWGGGRYDNLTQEVGGKEKISGVGFAMGDMVLEEILRANNLYPKLKVQPAKVLITIFGSETQEESWRLSLKLRQKGINCEIYLDPNAKLDKQLKYADKKGIPFVAIIGPDEAKNNTVTVKNMKSGEQKTVPLEEIIELLQDR